MPWLQNHCCCRQEREALLEERDELWYELRHAFIADVYTTLGSRMKEFQSKNKAAKAAGATVPVAWSLPHTEVQKNSLCPTAWL